ncbi:MAG: polyketide synthase, partial [Desulfobacterales bacterium]|nr:polyketide synthase [Desulfobacterales bacterium]
ISGLAAILAKRGAAVGIQVGTNYLFTREIVETGALKNLYQEVVLKAKKTMVIGNTVGLASRTVGTPFAEKMLETEHRLIKEGEPLGRRKTDFENHNIGSLLIGAKAFHPDFSNPEEVRLVHHDEKSQYEKGNFLVGDCLAFNARVTTVEDVHALYFNRKKRLADNLNRVEVFSSPTRQLNDEIAIIGMGCIHPGASTPEALWDNILAKTCAIRETPADRLNQDFYYDADRKAEDKTYSRIAGVVEDFVFDHEKYGYTEEKAAKLSRSQKMLLEAAHRAAEDAGCLDENGRIRAGLAASTAVIAASCLGNELASDLHQKYHFPEVRHHLDQVEAFTSLPEERQEALLETLKRGLAGSNDGYEPVHGAVLNMEAGRIAHHMGAEGPNFAVDAACATSFTAFDIAVGELLRGTCDMVIAGGVNTNLAPETFVGFSKMGALSNDGSWPFDERASGFVLGEGAGVFVLKRVKDAIRDKDRVHAVIKAVGASSDGKGKAIAAPNAKGQALALARCYEKIKSDVAPSDIGFIEAHGTSTILGDATEIETLKAFYNGDAPIGISSIKSQIGHLLGGSGAAGLAKAVLALKHKTLPPNGGFQTLSPKCDLSGSALSIITEAKKWEAPEGRTRKAAVSSYGFGGINYHAVVEEYVEGHRPLPRKIFADPDHDFNGDRIVAVGLGVVLPGAGSADAFWGALAQGGGGLSAMPGSRFHNEYYAMEAEDSHYHLPMVKAGVVENFTFNNAKYRIPPLAARSVDRAQLFALDAASQAVDQAGLLPRLTPGNKTAVILGTIPGTRQVENILRVRTPLIRAIIESVDGVADDVKSAIGEAVENRIRERHPKNSEDTIPGLLSNILSGRIANYLGCNGANYVVDASCASGAVAIDQAMKGLQSGDHDFVITGGVDANLYPGVMLAFKRLGLLSDGECRFFDKKASGYVMGEGAAVQILTTWRKAREHNMPVLGEINGFHMASSAPAHLLAPNQAVYASAMNGLYDRIGVNKEQVAHLDVFGVSNFLLDSVEKQAVESSFRHPTFFGNVKPEFGYFKAANPSVVLTKLMLMIRNGALLPNRSHSETDTIVGENSILHANGALLDASRRRTFHLASNVNGIGGNHGHMVVGALPPWMDDHAMEKHAAETIPMEKREVKPGRMEAAKPAETPRGPTFAPPSAPPLAPPVDPPAVPAPAIAGGGVLALLSGQGAQRKGMMRELYGAMEGIRSMMDRGDRIFRKARGYSILDIMFNDAERLNL